MNTEAPTAKPAPWNKGRMIGQKAPLKVRDIWAIRVRLQLGRKTRDLALFNLAIDSKLRACIVDLPKDPKLARGPDPAGTHEAREHRPVPRY